MTVMISPQRNRGFSQICPLIAEFDVLEEDSPIFEFSGSGGADNLYRLQDLFQTGLASPMTEMGTVGQPYITQQAKDTSTWAIPC